MKPPPRKLTAEWRARLKASGFVDLEVGTGELLSNRGNSAPRDEHDAARRDAAQAYYDGAAETLRRRRFDNPEEREVWRLHSQHVGQHRIAAETGLTYWRVRAIVAKVAVPPTSGARSERSEAQCRADTAIRLVRRSDATILALLGASLLRSLLRRTPRRCLGGASP